MNDIFLAKAREEADRLHADLKRSSADFRRLELLRYFIRQYEQTTEAPAAQEHVSPSPMPIRRPRSESLSAVVCKATEEFLEQIGRRAESSEISQEMARRGIEIVGKKPASVIASYLSTSDRFDNVRGQGYGLRKWSALPVMDAFTGSESEAAPSAKEDAA